MIYAKDTKKYTACAYPRYFVKQNAGRFKVGEEITALIAKDGGMWNLQTWKYGFHHRRSYITIYKRSCQRKVVGKDIFNRPVCSAHAAMAVTEARSRLKVHEKEIAYGLKGVEECQKVISRLS